MSQQIDCEAMEDDIDVDEKSSREAQREADRRIQERLDRGEKISFCPGCGQEWNNSYCRYCGHPH